MQVRAHLGQALLPCLAHESFPLFSGLDALGVAQSLEALEAAAWLYARYVVAPLFSGDRVGGVEESAGAEHHIEVGFGATLYGFLGSLGDLIEADMVLRLDVLLDVVVGEQREEECYQ